MSKKIFSSTKLGFSYLVFVIFSFLSYANVNAQCAGISNSITVCDIPNPSSQSINLFSLLGGTPTPGGTWTDNDLSGGFNTTTGVLNAQLITQSGIYTYTYTVTGVPGCVNNTSTLTVTVGGFSGITGPNASVCSDSGSFNLFQVFNGSSILTPQFNGTWFNNTTNSTVTGSSINVTALGIGTFQFTYTIAAIGTCPAKSSVAFVTIYKAPEAGTPQNLILCEDVNFGLYTNLDLNNLLTGEDSGGRWIENNATGEIAFISDHNINLQTIYNTFGAGTYSFTYTVQPSNPICTLKTATVSIIIEKKLDFTGGKLVVNSDICETLIPTAIYTASITQGLKPVANGSYNVTYQVTNPGVIATNTIVATSSGGVMTFPIPSSNFQQVGVYTITITNVTIPGNLGTCTNIVDGLNDTLTIFPKPALTNAVLNITPVCKGLNALVQITEATSLANGTYNIVYNLSGSNTANGQTAVITVNNGVASFIVPSNLIPTAGTTVITITNITNNTTTCTNTVNLAGNIIVNPLPVASNLTATVNSICLGQPLVVLMSGLGPLSNVTISYTISGANTAALQTTSLVVTSGNGSFTIPTVLIPNTGTSSITITDLTNTGNSCGVIVNNLTRTFTINPIPVAPVAANQIFCQTDNATIANLTPTGNQYQWFNSATSTTPLASTTPLVSGNYYIRNTNIVTGCQSLPTMISVVINVIPTATLNPDGALFCGLDNPTLQSLSNNTNSGSTIVWYSAPGGNVLPNTTLLQDATTYYGFNTAAGNNCLSVNGLSVTVNLTNCVNPPLFYDFFIPDGFSPNDDGVNDSYTIPNIEFLFPNYTFEIYNRYGNLMFKGDKNNPKWDGKPIDGVGGIAPNGVYFYIVNFNKDDAPAKQGRIYLNR